MEIFYRSKNCKEEVSLGVLIETWPASLIPVLQSAPFWYLLLVTFTTSVARGRPHVLLFIFTKVRFSIHYMLASLNICSSRVHPPKTRVPIYHFPSAADMMLMGISTGSCRISSYVTERPFRIRNISVSRSAPSFLGPSISSNGRKDLMTGPKSAQVRLSRTVRQPENSSFASLKIRS